MTCKRIAKLLSEQLDHELPLSRRLMIRAHLSWCIFCRRLSKHLILMRKLCEEASEASISGKPLLVDAELSPEAKARMQKLLSS